MNINELRDQYEHFKNPYATGRYLDLEQFDAALSKHGKDHLKISQIGESEVGRPISLIEWGSGDVVIFMWSQMHADETSTTQALLDYFGYLKTSKEAEALSKKVTLKIIPMLNPDGAFNYTRANQNDIDLNREAQTLTQKESILLRKMHDEIKPNFGFNMHHQPAIYGVKKHRKSVLLSFLTPTVNEEKSVVPSRELSMKVIADIFEMLDPVIPNRITRYNDAFSLRFFGDTIQSLGTPVILFEGGHESTDYGRTKIREFLFYSLVKAVESAAETTPENAKLKVDDYFKIPDSDICYYDIIVRDVMVAGKPQDVAIQYQEKLLVTDDNKRKVQFIPIIKEVGDLTNFYGHVEKNYTRTDVIPASALVPETELTNGVLKSMLDLQQPI